MAGKQLKEIFRAFHARDELAFRRAASEIIEEEQAKHHNALARDLQRLLVANGRAVDSAASIIVPSPPRDREDEWDLAEVREPSKPLDEIILSKRLTSEISEICNEVRSWDKFDARGIRRRQRLLLEGPPGCGKTSAAEAIAYELGRPFVLVRLDAVISSYLGETASNLRRIMDYANQGPYVVLFDEFDALGRSRDESSEHGEMKRVVTAFLQMTDRYSGPSLLIAATNHSGLLDSALWRRFDEVLSFQKPSVHEIRSLLRSRLRTFSHEGVQVDQVASKMKGLPHAAVEKLVDDARRYSLLRGQDRVNNEDFDAVLPRVLGRPW